MRADKHVHKFGYCIYPQFSDTLLLTVLCMKISTGLFYYLMMCLQAAGRMVNTAQKRQIWVCNVCSDLSIRIHRVCVISVLDGDASLNARFKGNNFICLCEPGANTRLS